MEGTYYAVSFNWIGSGLLCMVNGADMVLMVYAIPKTTEMDLGALWALAAKR